MNKQLESLLSNGVLAVGGLASFVILSHYAPVELFGEWFLFLTLCVFVDLLRFGLTRSAVVRMIARDCDNPSGVCRMGASSLLSNIVVVAGVSVAMWLGAYFLGDYIQSKQRVYYLFLLYYPVVAWMNLGWNNALSVLQGQGQFFKIMMLRGLNMVVFVAGVIWLVNSIEVSFLRILGVYLLSNAVSSLLSFIKGWDSSRSLRRASKADMKEIFSFGRFALWSTVSSSLLRSADSFIVGLSPVLGVTGVAILAVPFKSVEAIELPVRSVAQVAYNRLSRAWHKGDIADFRGLLSRYMLLSGAMVVPISLMLVLMPELILEFFGGSQYEPYFGVMRVMLYLLAAYGLALVVDRLTGVALEAIGRPKMNLVKVGSMALLNIVGNLVAVFVLNSLLGVVVVTVSFVLLGVAMGWWLLPKDLRPRGSDFLRQWRFLVRVVRRAGGGFVKGTVRTK